MSVILEALRRSEAERQRGKAPGLFVEQAPPRRRPGGIPRWALAAAAVVLLAVLAAWGWREWGRDAPAIAVTPVVESAAPTVPPPGAAAPAIDVPVVDAPRPAPVESPAADPVRPPPVAGPVAPFPAEAAPPAPAPEPVIVEPERVATVDAAVPSPAPAPVDPAPAPSVAPPPATTTPGEAVPGLATLSSGERAALPPLKLSMHVYNDDPARRFVIVDGKRLVEGASVADGIVVDAIRRDGAVLAINGRRLLLSRP